jgi:protoheme IX farnesyltransferase
VSRASDYSPLPAGDLLGAADIGPGARLSAVYELTKPRMNALVLVTTGVGFLVAPVSGSIVVLLHALLGTALAAAGASVLNQFLERDHDARMPRTRRRPLPAGLLPPGFASGFGIVLSLLGVIYLASAVNVLTALLAAVTIVTYVAIYTPLKRLSPWCTLVGAVPGAIPPMMGVTAATGSLDATAWVLFAILFFWQMPHFFGLATLYADDYARGGFRMLPGESDGERRAGRQVVFFAILTGLAGLTPVLVTPGVGWAYGMVAAGAGAWYLSASLRMARSTGAARRPASKRLFVVSILHLPVLLSALVLDAFI